MTLTPVLDHGSVELVDSMASDRSVLTAMLISTGKDKSEDEVSITSLPAWHDGTPDWQTKLVAKNHGRINFLMRDHHGTPFEHNAMVFRVVAPIFVVREWHRHRIGWSYNEISGRYTTLPDVWYIPDEVRTRVGKPGRYTYEELDPINSLNFKETLEFQCRKSYEYYQEALGIGVAPEQARLFLHVNHYTSFYATCNARSLMHFLNLRGEGTTAQWEIQQYANELETVWSELMPVTHECFVENGRIAP